MKTSERFGSYLDGTMPRAERAAFEAEMESNPTLKAELEGYRSFVFAMRTAGAAQTTPVAELSSHLSALCSAAKPRRQIRTPLLGFAACAAIAISLWTILPKPDWRPKPDISLATSPVLESVEVSEPAQAIAWARKRTGIAFKPVVMGFAQAQIYRGSVGKAWECFDYHTGRGDVCLAVSRTDDFSKGYAGTCGTWPVFVGQGIGFRHDGLSFYISGADTETLKWLAEGIQSELNSRAPSVQVPR